MKMDWGLDGYGNPGGGHRTFFGITLEISELRWKIRKVPNRPFFGPALENFALTLEKGQDWPERTEYGRSSALRWNFSELRWKIQRKL
jgi:hypothetical protein